MPEFLSSEWVAALADAGAGATVPDGVRIVLQQVVVDDDGAEVPYVVRIADGAVSVEPGRADDADVTFTQDRATAEAIADGTLSAQAAFLAGRLQVGGDLTVVLDGARELASVADVFARARA
jgi:putative sterol carrier protein